MRLGLLVLPLLALPLACSFDSGGQPEVGSDDEASNTGTETATEGTADEIGTGDQGSSSDEVDGDGDGESSSDATDDATDSTSDATESSTDATESSTDDATDATDTTDDATDTSTESSDTSTETGMEPDYYGACPNGEDDCEPSEYCKTDVDLFDTWSVCATPCESTDECPAELGFPLICINYEIFAQKTCHIDCDGNECPPGMSCKGVNAGFDRICVYEP